MPLDLAILAERFSALNIDDGGVVQQYREYTGVTTGVSKDGLHVTLNASTSPNSRDRVQGLVHKMNLPGLSKQSSKEDVQRVVRSELQIGYKGAAVNVKVLQIRDDGKLGLRLVANRGTAQNSTPRRASGGESGGANAPPQLREDNRAPCQNYLRGLCTFPHPWLPGTPYCSHGSHEPRPAGYGQWLVNRGLDEKSPDRHSGWVYGGKLAVAPNGQKAALAYRRVGVDAIEELRKQYGKVMGNHTRGHKVPFPKLFFAYPDEPIAANGKATELWSYKSADADLPGAVFGIRRFVEVLLGENARLQASGAAVTYLSGDDREERWRKLYYHAKSLNRSSKPGADVPLQWSAHAQLNPYDHTEVTERTLVEIVAKLGVILEQLFTGRVPDGVEVNPRAVAPALQAAVASPSIIDKDNKRDNAAHNNPGTVFRAAFARRQNA